MTESVTAPPQVTGVHLIAGAERPVPPDTDTFQAVDPRSGQPTGTRFAEAGPDEVAAAAAAADSAFGELRSWAGRRRGELLRDIAACLEEQREPLVEIADAETALGGDRLVGELARTCAQLRAFAALVEVSVSTMHRQLDELVDWLFRGQDFPVGVVLLTGTSIVPPLEFTLQQGDVVTIEIPGIGRLRNPVDVRDTSSRRKPDERACENDRRPR